MQSYDEVSFVHGVWADFREDVFAVAPELASIIDEISPGKEFPLIKARYTYGTKITNLGEVQLPSRDNNPIYLRSSASDPKLRELLDYCPTPMILQLRNTAEAFIEAGSRIVPLNVFHPGDLYGLMEFLEVPTGCEFTPCWSVTSGIRSVFMSAKIGNDRGNQRLQKEYRIKLDDSGTLPSQWTNFKKIIARGQSEPWTSETLLFTRPWCQAKPETIEWLRFADYIKSRAWVQSKNVRARSEYGAIWAAFAAKVAKRNFSPDAYTVNTLMYLLSITNSGAPGFKLLLDRDDFFMPNKVVEQAYSDVYGMLRDYAPVLLHPVMLSTQEVGAPVYYSFSTPTLVEGAFIRMGGAMETMKFIRQLMPLMAMLDKMVIDNTFNLPESWKKLMYKFFHTKEDSLDEILRTAQLADNDSDIGKLSTLFPGKQFAHQGPFFRGCVMLSKKD